MEMNWGQFLSFLEQLKKIRLFIAKTFQYISTRSAQSREIYIYYIFIFDVNILCKLHKVGFAERNKLHVESLKKKRDANLMLEKEKTDKLENQWSRLNVDVDWNFSDTDRDR